MSHPGGAPTLTEAAFAYGSSRRNMKQVARKLVARGYLELEQILEDALVLRIRATIIWMSPPRSRAPRRAPVSDGLFSRIFDGLEDCACSSKPLPHHPHRVGEKPVTRVAFAVVLALHGLIHLMGFAKAFGFAVLPQLARPISRPMGLLWLVAALLSLATVGAVFLAPHWWWAVGAVAMVTSQAVIVTSWSDAKFGTLANLVLLLGSLYGFASRGPLSLRNEFEHDLERATAPTSPEVLSEAELAPLPEPVQRYVRRSGVVGHPRVQGFRATWTGRIRSDANSAWMAFTAEQLTPSTCLGASS
jgi:hypothetical protein